MTITRNYIMKILVLLGLVALVASITFAEFQEQMLAAVTSPFVHLLFAYDSSSERKPLDIQLDQHSNRSSPISHRRRKATSKFSPLTAILRIKTSSKASLTAEPRFAPNYPP